MNVIKLTDRGHGQATSRSRPLTSPGPAAGHTADAQPRDRTGSPGLRPVAAQERAARARLYPVGTVIAMPVRPPLDDDGGPSYRPAA